MLNIEVNWCAGAHDKVLMTNAWQGNTTEDMVVCTFGFESSTVQNKSLNDRKY